MPGALGDAHRVCAGDEAQPGGFDASGEAFDLDEISTQRPPGGALVGCDAGYLNASRIKGSHAAIKTGMLAAEAAYDALVAGRSGDELSAYPEAFEASWLHTELNKARNFKQWFKKEIGRAHV